MSILLLGASGLLGNTLLRYFNLQSNLEVVGTSRSLTSIKTLSKDLQNKVIPNIDVENSDHLLKVISEVKPDIIINCVGVVKQLHEANDPLSALPINAILPHRLAKLTEISGARLIHFSTDCVFSGKKGNYLESDQPDASDIYGISKWMGEVDHPNVITLRTSLIGHELSGNRSLVNWFLSQNGSIKGYQNAIFSGLPAIEIAKVLHHFVLPNSKLHGLYHLSADPISKYQLLSIIADIYKKKIEIIPDYSYVIDRSLDSSRFRTITGFSPKSWPEMIKAMHDFR